MSGANAIHGVILVGAIIVLGTGDGTVQTVLGFLAVVLATINVVGGFVVTDRMLEMFKGRRGGGPGSSGGGGPGNAPPPTRRSSCFARGGSSSPPLGWWPPRGARRGNSSAPPAPAWGGGTPRGAAGVAVAVATPFAFPGLPRIGLTLVAFVTGIAAGLPAARLVKMTAIPQMVAAFNGVGGGAAALVSLAEFNKSHAVASTGTAAAVLFSVLVGALSFSGSAVTYAKLQELMTGRPIV